MAIQNKRVSITENSSENRLKTMLKEDFKKFMKEAPEEEDMDELSDDLDTDTDDLDTDELDMDSDEMGSDDGLEMDADMDTNSIDDLTDTEAETVDHWIDELLSDSLEQSELNNEKSLDTESLASDLDPIGDESYIHEDLPMTKDDMQNIIDSDDSLVALENELAALAVQNDIATESDELNDEELEDNEELEESTDPLKGIDKYFNQEFEGEDNKEIGMTKVNSGLKYEVTNKVKPTPGAKTIEEIKKDAYEIVKESTKKSKMLVKAAGIIAKAQNNINKQTKLIESLKLENYKLIKANGILSVAGDTLSKEARTQISESFDKCQNIEQINKFYVKLTEKIKTANKPSLNNLVNNNRTKINVIKESVNKEKESISYDQERINMLMGYETKNDVYFK